MNTEYENWIDEIKKHYTFPCCIAFSLIIDKDDSTKLVSSLVAAKEKIDVLQYNTIKAMGNGKSSALLEVKELNSAEEYFEEIVKLKEIWRHALVRKANNKMEIKELYILAKKDEEGNVIGYPQGGGSSTASYIRAFEKRSSANRSKSHLGGTVMRVVALEDVD